MQKVTVTVDPDGRVKIPGTSPGQTVTIRIVPEATPGEQITTRTLEEQEQFVQELLEEGRRNRAQADPEWLARDHDEWLYGPDGLPK